jgi:enoyl-CoA hydratase/carnithine racemase
MSEVLFRTEPLASGGQAGIATLNVEKTLNSLTLNMVDLLSAQLAEWEADPAIAFVWFEGAGDRAFCAGGDIQNLYHDMVKHPGGPCPYCEEFFEREYRLDYQLHTFAKPTIVWGHGVVMGGGLGIASACRYRIGTEKTRIAMPEITIGLIPDAGATWSFMQMPKYFAYFLALTGAQINGEDAKLVGLVNQLIGHEHREAVLNGLLAKVSLSEADAGIASVLSSFDGNGEFPPSQLQSKESEIRTVMTEVLEAENPVENFVSVLDRLSGDAWLEKAAATFRHGAPTTAQLIVGQFMRAETMNLKEMLMQELTLASQCSRHPDFAEGVRALLIDKDGQPKWQQAELGGVPDGWIEAHFQAPWGQHPLADLDENRMRN